jgi:hypothetical protein
VAVRDGVAEGLLRFVGLNPPTTGSSARSARAARTTDAGDGGLGDLDGGGFNPVASDFSGETPQGQLNGHGILALPERPNGKEIERQVMHVGGQTGVLHPPQTGIASFTGPGFQEYDWQLGTGPQARRIKLNVPGNAYDIGPYPFNCVQSVPEGTPLTPGPGDVATAPDDGYWLAGCGTNYIAVWPANDGDCPTFTVVAPTGWTKVKGEDVQCGFYVEQPDHTVIWTEVTGERDAFFMPWWETVDGFWDGSPPWWQWKYSDPSPLDLDGFTGKLGPAINDPANPEFNTFGNNTVNSEGEGDDEGIGEGPLENPDRDPDTAYPRIPDDAQIAAMATHALEDDKHAKDFDGDTTAEKIANAEARIRDAVEDGKVWALPRGRTGFTRVGEPHVIIHTPVRGSDGTHNPNQGTIFIPDNGETPEDYMKRQQRDRPDRNLGA